MTSPSSLRDYYPVQSPSNQKMKPRFALGMGDGLGDSQTRPLEIIPGLLGGSGFCQPSRECCVFFVNSHSIYDLDLTQIAGQT